MIAKLLTGHVFDPRELFDGSGRAVLAHWLLLSALTVAVVLACWVGVRWVRGWREREAADAVWLAIRTPTTVSGDAGVFARRVAGVLHRTRQFGVRARHIVLEVHATDHGAQIGVWVPPGIDSDEIAAAITGAWPSAEVTPITPPDLNGGRAVVAKEVTARNGVWAPWIDPHHTTGMAGRAGQVTDPLGGVLDRLAARGEGETGFVQLVLGTYHRATLQATTTTVTANPIKAERNFTPYQSRSFPRWRDRGRKPAPRPSSPRAWMPSITCGSGSTCAAPPTTNTSPTRSKPKTRA